MAPQNTTSSQQYLAQAAQKLSSAIAEAGAAPNEFALNLVELLEVSTKINEFDEMASAANAETTTEEAQKWREISLMTMQHARTHLVEQQQRLIEQLRTSSESGASLYKGPVQSAEVEPDVMAVKPHLEVKPAEMAVQPPPGMAGPPGLAKTSKQTAGAAARPPPGLKPPPGLASAGTAKVTPPPGFSPQKAAQKPKKPVAGYPKSVKSPQMSFFESRFGKEASAPAAPAVVNLDAYDSD
eukprot:gnl/MRDRNA2_/MRDRNA2_88884_c0_seq1.p1 gnl/MRDRNA2_/MRDRNA2_88884_c0~~gnl/MRDRNA2_/MRDRNA2_88884_c0_seq1.p1  ORF type:complete len:240 (+),score=64.68 gnl/MRDRNA2_/MRDRNA2_88884_c0_seq1:179-898(+)